MRICPVTRSLKSILSSIALLTFAWSGTAEAGGKLTIATSEWEDLTQKDGTGLYFEVLNEIFGKDGYSYQLLPWKRAQSEFQGGKVDAILGEDNTRKAAYPKWPCDANKFSVLYKKSALGEYKPEMLQSKTSVWVRGYDVQLFVKGLTKYQEVTDLSQGAKMLAAGRADLLIDFPEDLETVAKKEKLDPKDFVIAEGVVNGGFLYLAFQDNEAGRARAKEYDAGMDKLRKSGKLQELFSKWERKAEYEEILAEVDKK